MWGWDSVCKGGIKWSSLNVFINTNLMKNKEVAVDMNQKSRRIVKEGK